MSYDRMSDDTPCVIIIAECISCHTPIMAHRLYAPSLRDDDGQRCPICKSCFHLWNKIHRTSKGLKPETLHPLAYSPEELYDEPCN